MTVLRRAAAAGAAIAAVAAGAVLPVAPAPAAVPPSAAVCAALDLADLEPDQLRDYAAQVDFVFVGRVLQRRALAVAERSGPRDRTRRYAHTVAVKAAFKGDVRNVVEVLTDTARATGLGPLRARADHLFFVTEIETGRTGALSEDRRFEAVECSGTTELAEPMGTRLERQLAQVLSQGDDPEVAVELTEPSGGATEPPSLTRSVAPGVALGLVGLLGLLLLSRAGRRA